MENLNQYDKETFEIFKDECSAIIEDFKLILSDSSKYTSEEYITKLMRDAHSIKGSASITGLDEIQKKAHKIEDILGSMKQIQEPEQKKQLHKEVHTLILEIEDRVKQSEFFSQETKYCPEIIFKEIIHNMNLLKTDIKYIDEVIFLIEKIDTINPTMRNIIDISISALNKIKATGEIKDKNLINILCGAFKILKKIQPDNNENYYDELYLLKQRLSVAEQMINISTEATTKKITETQTQEAVKSKFSISNVFENFSESSIRTLRIDSSKLDKLYDKICEIGNLSTLMEEKNRKIKCIIEKFSENIFEFEKIKADLINDKENEQSVNKKDYLSKEIAKISSDINECQNLMKEYERINSNENNTEKEYQEKLLEIYSIIKNVRKLPIGVILHMFPRMVRDLAEKENKEVEMDITGGEILVDKKILDTIKMPILHLLRNAVDHGIELPEVREKEGKQRAGKISIMVKTSDENIKINIKDDGCGINFTKIKAKLLKDNLLKDVKQLNKRDFLKFLFIPGFSTEDKVTEISGRGMGLDIVHTQITAINGNIQITTHKNQGTEIQLELPKEIIPFKPIDTQKKAFNKEESAKIMIADDSQTTKMFFKKILEEEGYEIKTFENGKDALKELKNNKYDLLISDVEMPVMNGAELASKIRNNKKLKNLQIMIISMLSEDKINNLFKNIDIDAVINKTDFNKNIFINTVKYLLDKN